MNGTRLVSLAVLLWSALACSCSTLVTPERIRASAADPGDRERAVLLWEQALVQANAYLASELRLSLPAGQYEFDETDSMVFVTAAKRWPIGVWNSCGGRLVVWFGFRAQERDDGFVVGPRPPKEHALIDHSMFRTLDGDWHSADSIARLILHETAHTLHGVGTVGYWNTLLYYLESVFLFRAANHSAERRPRAVSQEYLYFTYLRDALVAGDQIQAELVRSRFDAHVAKEHRNCTHGLE